MVERPTDLKHFSNLSNGLSESAPLFPDFTVRSPQEVDLWNIKASLEALAGGSDQGSFSAYVTMCEMRISLERQRSRVLSGDKLPASASKSPEHILKVIDDAQAQLTQLIKSYETRPTMKAMKGFLASIGYAEYPQKRRLSLLQRLANVGLGRRDEEHQPPIAAGGTGPSMAPMPALAALARAIDLAEPVDEGTEADWQQVKVEVLKLLQAELLDTPTSHLAYIRDRIKPVFDHDPMES